MWLCQVLAAAHEIFIASCGISVAVHGLSSCGVSSFVETRELSCSAVCGILVPGTDIEPGFLALQGGSLPLDHQGRPCCYYF